MYLMSQMWWYLLLAFLLGVLIGYLLWRTCNLPLLQSRFERSRKDLVARAGLLEEERSRISDAVSGAEGENGKLKAELAAMKTAATAGPVSAAPAGLALSKPPMLSAPRGGKADDLKLVWGVGTKLEKMLNAAGFFHFDQIAKWTEKEIAWVDTQLGEFSGRAERDKWVEQCKKLASGWRPESADGDKPH